VRPAGRRRLQRRRDHLGDLRVGDGAQHPRTGLIPEPVKALGSEAVAPGCYRDAGDAKVLGDRDVTDALCRQQYDLGAQGIGPGDLPTPQARGQLGPLGIR
jgi:hypothetical protein